MLGGDFQLIKQGAEAKIYKGLYIGKSTLVKERFKKSYRHVELDEHLTKERIRAETRSIMKCKVAVKDYIASLTDENSEEKSTKKKLDHVAQEIGKTLGKMHANNIIHGDLTTSNMLLVDKGDVKVLVMIDFGLSHGNASAMNKGVDLYVLERAILSTHANVESLFPAIIKFYIKANKDSAEVMKKLEEVRARGRKRTMVG
uniref:non-specific serine/threonine protein kinase n=1 Tax=Timema bartmani TaxID=61472 RepID=A0A7R9EXA5_9NEOP|nr:unnamed protein product [Timema bartmani]